MLGTDRSTEIIEQSCAQDVQPACTALVPLAEPVRWTGRLAHHTLPEPGFVTQLIATSEHYPQTCSLRRAEVSDALSAYAPPPRVQRSGLRTRQSI